MLVMIDLDNTLADRDAAVRAWIAEFCEAHGLSELDAAWLLEIDNDGYSERTDVFAEIKARFGLGDRVEDLLVAYRQRVVELTVPSPGAAKCLESLREQGHTIVIVSNGSSGQQHAKIDVLGLRDLVDEVCISGDLGIKKPAPAIFEHAARSVGVTIEASSWMVGDSATHDVVGAAALGMRTAWLRRGRPWTNSDVQPTVTLESLGDFEG